MYLLYEKLMRKNAWIRLNPGFSVPWRNLENSTRNATIWFRERVSRRNISRPLISFRIVQYRFVETPSRNSIGCCRNIPDLKKNILYNLLVMIGQCYNKDVNDELIVVEPKQAKRVCKNH